MISIHSVYDQLISVGRDQMLQGRLPHESERIVFNYQVPRIL